MIYSVIQYLFYTLHGCFLPYVTVFLMEWGVDTVAIGLILSANAAVMVLAQVFWGIAADKVGFCQKGLSVQSSGRIGSYIYNHLCQIHLAVGPAFPAR